jgi:two-component system NtrC family response regulator/two-component system response regulator HydG
LIRVLLISRDHEFRRALEEVLSEIAGDGSSSPHEAPEAAAGALVLTDFKAPSLAAGWFENAVIAIREGAAPGFLAPVSTAELLRLVERALERRRRRVETPPLRHRGAEHEQCLENMVGSSARMRALVKTVQQVAPSHASVLISGESGTGKELVAAAIHQHSARHTGPFVKLHCAALAETLLESELFGHEKGSFTGALARRDGRFQEADGGTLFLDEIGDISPALQVKLLRFLQEHEFERVGGNQTIKVDVRVLAATHRNLLERIKEGKFREDLYYRLNVVSVEVPALRERPADIPLLAMHFLRRYGRENQREVAGFDDHALTCLARYRWPGNVRELEHLVERAVVLCRNRQIGLVDLPIAIVHATRFPEEREARIPGSTLAEVERHVILKTLEHTGGSTARAAEILGISIRKIQYKLQEYADENGEPATGSD